MSHESITRSAIALFGAGGMVGVQLVGVGAAAATPSTGDVDDCGYAVDVVTATDLTLDRTALQPGETTTARVTVTSGVGVPRGTVTFQVDGGQPATVGLSAGAASFMLPADLDAGAGYVVTATYPGAECWLPSSDAATVRVDDEIIGVDTPPEDDEDDEVAGVARSAPSGALPSVGADAGLTWFGLGGLGLLGAGAISLLLHRLRRSSS